MTKENKQKQKKEQQKMREKILNCMWPLYKKKSKKWQAQCQATKDQFDEKECSDIYTLFKVETKHPFRFPEFLPSTYDQGMDQQINKDTSMV